MKTLSTLAIVLALLAVPARAAQKVESGPRKGRLLKLQESSAEFLVEPNRGISIAFYDAAKKQQPPTDQIVTAIAERPAGKKTLEFERKGELLVSKEPLPEGEGYNVVVQVKEKANEKPKNFRIKLVLSLCEECGHAEYACICAH